MDSRCQQFTPNNIANEMLDILGYKDNLYGKKILENSCGEGNILCLIVERYIEDAYKNGYTPEEIVIGLERDIYGAEIVELTYRNCLSKLDNILDKFGLGKVRWNIFLGDVLTMPFDCKFDYVIGNPPYVSYGNLDQETREYIRTKYKTCSYGKPDYCYAFIENAIYYLSETGSMVYLIPNSIYKNVYAEDLRKFLLRYVELIKDFSNYRLFDDATTSSAVMLLKKGSFKKNINYINVLKKECIIIDKNSLVGKWVFKTMPKAKNKYKFGDYFNAAMAIATQRNKVFVINEEIKRKHGIERGILRTAISPRNQQNGNKEYIIFPYRIRSNNVISYKEEEIKAKYPKAFLYLNSNREELDKRDSDKNAKWFEFGRSQAIQNMNEEKLLISTVVTNKVNVYELNTRAVPYSGIYIIPKTKGKGLEEAKQILESDSFLQYVKSIGTPASGSSVRITARDINEFYFE